VSLARSILTWPIAAFLLCAAAAHAQTAEGTFKPLTVAYWQTVEGTFKPPAAADSAAAESGFKPIVGQEGKDVVWVPTPPVLVEKMLDMAKVTPQDFVMDLGSGDGRNIIAAAKRGARALGVEFNPNMVELATREAQEQGVGDRAKFVQGDMYEADISQATVLALFLLPENLRKLTPKFLDLKPGTRIVANHFGIDGWEADETGRSDGDCMAWCTALLYIVPAKVAGTWKLPQGELALEQKFQTVSGSFTSGGSTVPVRNGKLSGDRITFAVGDAEYTGRVAGDAMQGTVKGSSHGAWSATRGN
jgi:SAM-dependent methyltransferase